MGLSQKEIVETLRIQWKKLWQERVDDKLRAEGIATADYCDLHIEKGTVIHATRDYKALNFKEILEQHQVANADRFIPLCPQVGGWTKFVKLNITNHGSRKRQAKITCKEKQRARAEEQQARKGGRGWLHL